MGETVRTERDHRGVVTVTLDRPEVRNAFNDRLIAELREVAAGLAEDASARVVVLTGAGSVFSAGADINWMRSMRDFTFEQNAEDARRMDAMFRALYDLPKPLVGRINGPALGGAGGLVAVCDIAIAARTATFGFTEVTLGITPAVVSPYVVRKIGVSAARALFVTGERFDAERALAIGLVHELVEDIDALDLAVAAAVERCLQAGPVGAAAAKHLVEQALRPLDEATADTPELIARLRVGEEAQEGMRAFFERRPPGWVP